MRFSQSPQIPCQFLQGNVTTLGLSYTTLLILLLKEIAEVRIWQPWRKYKFTWNYLNLPVHSSLTHLPTYIWHLLIFWFFPGNNTWICLSFLCEYSLQSDTGLLHVHRALPVSYLHLPITYLHLPIYHFTFIYLSVTVIYLLLIFISLPVTNYLPSVTL